MTQTNHEQTSLQCNHCSSELATGDNAYSIIAGKVKDGSVGRDDDTKEVVICPSCINHIMTLIADISILSKPANPLNLIIANVVREVFK